MERKINSCGVIFINFADFDLAEFVDEITADCSLMRDIGESSKKEKSSLFWLSKVILWREQLPFQSTQLLV